MSQINVAPLQRVLGDLVFALPLKLLERVQPILQPSEALTKELGLSAECQFDRAIVGVWRETPIQYELLSRIDAESIEVDKSMIDELGWQENSAQIEHMLRIADERSVHMHVVAKGFAGWLMATPAFLREHDELLINHSRSVLNHGLPSLTLGRQRQAESVAGHETHRDFVSDVNAFLLRWRLAGLAAPYLPIPLRPMIPASHTSLAGPLSQVGCAFYFPDTFPILSRDTLRDVLTDALRTESHEHLGDWMKIIARENTAKSLNRFGKLFEIQHYLRTLGQRFGPSFKRNLGRFEAAFADFFGVKPETIHADFNKLRAMLGERWNGLLDPSRFAPHSEPSS